MLIFPSFQTSAQPKTAGRPGYYIGNGNVAPWHAYSESRSCMYKEELPSAGVACTLELQGCFSMVMFIYTFTFACKIDFEHGCFKELQVIHIGFSCDAFDRLTKAKQGV